MRQYLLIALIAAVVTFVVSVAVYKLALKRGWHPPIRERDVHTRPTPRLGGVAMYVGVLVAVLVASVNPYFQIVFDGSGEVPAVLVSATLIVVIGVADDLWDLDWMIKLAAQFVTAGVIAWFGVQVYSLPIGGLTVGSSWLSFTLTVFIIVLVMNAVNFIDGLDGLVAGVALIANSVFFVYGYMMVRELGQSSWFNLSLLISAVLVGVCVGIMPLNFRPAKMFIGDGGALLVGLLMATSAIAMTGQINPEALGAAGGDATLGRSQLIGAYIPVILPIAILILPLLDFSLAVLRRLRAGQSPFAADRKHLHHRLLDLGHSHLNAVLVFYAWTSVISIACLLAFLIRPSWWAGLFLVVGVIVCTLFTIWPILSRRLSRRRSRSVPSPTPTPTPEELP
ncbi:MraY family glycosyltransferase [Mycetocola reblochoni]|uniref:Undecaprenyl-phosphate N-acetylglucosaminyl 1-phosphate transferase n=2 Tax=Mycetocola reblochoni TaxID=331618 RepID=A0A1R4JSX9_9MICO|nr:MraY family glycosyltransferase [Mycetocola reblochoni]RLP70389.1 undecaprenyl/decaprenyl-phosphate alpha-N-acetylglucosaminyl 1-phosphate transferase [Mycetocola reblochoni]SJN35371.1 Undecaprenyl-phosphate N-acetylglucosaminyl 1-phosphate transferase [Mycetocola reblochoni REB411]